MKANEIINEGPKMFALGQTAGAATRKVVDHPATQIAHATAKHIGHGVTQGLKQASGGSDPIGLGGFQPTQPVTDQGNTTTKASTVTLIDPQTKKPVMYTLKGNYWFDASNRAVSDENTVNVLNTQLKNQHKG